jgi:hypothetical protein
MRGSSARAVSPTHPEVSHPATASHAPVLLSARRMRSDPSEDDSFRQRAHNGYRSLAGFSMIQTSTVSTAVHVRAPAHTRSRLIHAVRSNR